MKKTLIILFLFTIPVFSYAQKNIYLSANANEDAGYHLQKASGFLIAGTVAEIAGGVVIAFTANNKDNQGYYNNDKDSKNSVYAGAAIAGAGLIMQLIGYIQIKRAGNSMRSKALTFTGTGLRYRF